MRNLSLFLGMFLISNYFLFADEAIELIRISILKVEKEQGENGVISHAYGNVYRKRLSPDGTQKDLKSLTKIYLGRLQEMRKIESLKWYLVGTPDQYWKRAAQWGQTVNIKGRYYTPFVTINSLEEAIAKDTVEELIEDAENNLEEKLFEGFSPEEQQEIYEEEQKSGTETETPEESFPSEEETNEQEDKSNLERDAEVYEDERENSEAEENENMQIPSGEIEEDFAQEEIPTERIDEEMYLEHDELFRQQVLTLALDIKKQRSLYYKLQVFSQVFPEISANIKKVSRNIDLALENTAKRTAEDFFYTAVEYCIRTGDVEGFDYFVKRFHDQVKWKTKVYRKRKFSNGNTYKGQWKYGSKHGYGTYTHRSGKIYKGSWKYGKKNGHGVFVWPDGVKYVGQWKQDLKEGYGFILHPDNTISHRGVWRNGRYVGTYDDDDDEEYQELDEY